MSERVEVIAKLEKRAAEADAMIATLRRQIAEVRKAKFNCLIADNAKLSKEVESLKSQLIQVEIDNGLKQIVVPVVKPQKLIASDAIKKDHRVDTQNHVSPDLPSGYHTIGANSISPVAINVVENKSSPTKQPDQRSGNQPKGKPTQATSADEELIDVGRLDMRVGLILSAGKHPDADSLYVEQVDVGEEKHRTVVSGLVRFIPLGEMQNRLAVFLCNLKPAKMRGIVSEAMIMCASTPDNVEVLRPPPGSRPGQRVICEGYEATKPDKELNPKKKIFERIAPDLKTNDDRVATYKGCPWIVEGLPGHIVADTLANVNIK